MNLSSLAILSAIFLGWTEPNDPVAAEIDKAKEEYSRRFDEYQQYFFDWFDERENKARAIGDKRTVDQIKKERHDFKANGAIPKNLPKRMLRDKKKITPPSTIGVETALERGISEYTKIKKDEQADELQRQLDRLKAGDLSVARIRRTKGEGDGPNSRRRWIYSSGEFRASDGGLWVEKTRSGTTTEFKEVARTAEFVELESVKRPDSLRVRLSDGKCEYIREPGLVNFSFEGRWDD